MIIYPPLINELIPAFEEQEENIIIKVPFEHNPAVNTNNSNLKMVLLIKDYITSTIIDRKLITTSDFTDNIATFTIEKRFDYEISYLDYNNDASIKNYKFPASGQCYKIQLAYMDDDQATIDTLVWSAAALIRCVTEPEAFYINDQETGTIANTSIYTGVYRASYNSEPLYSYRFDFYSLGGELIQSTGEVLFNTNEVEVVDNEYKCSFYLNYTLSSYNETYVIKFTITTTNGYTLSTERQVQKAKAPQALYNFKLNSTISNSEGYVKFSFSDIPPNIPKDINAQFIIERSDKNQKKWEILSKVAVASKEALELFEYIDFSLEHNKTYFYRVRQFQNNVYSIPIDQIKIQLNFEDMFLTDGERQLKIKFNPQVSSFKNTLLEQKTDTIGSKYPYFFRNGNVGYKELPLSGLISYLMDENELFLSYEELELDNIENTPTTNLTDYNIRAEKIFKTKVLEWLNNGQPKLFRSPTEGNYILRLMNISLSPNTTLGRMLHTFNATGYECAAADLDSLRQLGLLKENNTNKKIVCTYTGEVKEVPIISTEPVYGYSTQNVENKNYFNIDNIPSSGWLIENKGDYLKKVTPENTTAGTYLNELCIYLVPDQVYTLSANSTSNQKKIGIIYPINDDEVTETIWNFGESLYINQKLFYEGVVSWYGEEGTEISNIQIELGGQVTEYEKYKGQRSPNPQNPQKIKFLEANTRIVLNDGQEVITPDYSLLQGDVWMPLNGEQSEIITKYSYYINLLSGGFPYICNVKEDYIDISIGGLSSKMSILYATHSSNLNVPFSYEYCYITNEGHTLRWGGIFNNLGIDTSNEEQAKEQFNKWLLDQKIPVSFIITTLEQEPLDIIELSSKIEYNIAQHNNLSNICWINNNTSNDNYFILLNDTIRINKPLKGGYAKTENEVVYNSLKLPISLRDRETSKISYNYYLDYDNYKDEFANKIPNVVTNKYSGSEIKISLKDITDYVYSILFIIQDQDQTTQGTFKLYINNTVIEKTIKYGEFQEYNDLFVNPNDYLELNDLTAIVSYIEKEVEE